MRNGRSSSSASSGPTWPVSASTELRPGEHEVERALACERGGERLGGRERVGAGERGVGDEHAVDVDVALEAPRDRLAERVVGRGRPEREHRDA